MRDHYNINAIEFAGLSRVVSVSDMIECVPLFSPNQSPASKVSLMLYVDKHGGDFLEDGNDAAAHERIALAIFNSMGSDDKVEILQYIQDTWDGDSD